MRQIGLWTILFLRNQSSNWNWVKPKLYHTKGHTFRNFTNKCNNDNNNNNVESNKWRKIESRAKIFHSNFYMSNIFLILLWILINLNALMTAIQLKLILLITIDNIDIIYNFSTFYELKDLLKSCNSFIDQNVNQFVTNFVIEDIKSIPLRITFYWKLLPILWLKRQEIIKDS